MPPLKKRRNWGECVEIQEKAKAEVSMIGEVYVTGAERSLEEVIKKGMMKILDSKC